MGRGLRSEPLALRFPMLLFMLLCATDPAHADELTPMGGPLGAAGFEEIADTRGVKVYQDRGAPLARVAAEGRMAATPAQVHRALLAYEDQKPYVKHVQSEVLERGDGRLYVYQRLEFPVTSDRDFTLLVTWGTEGETLWIRFEAVTDHGPQKKQGVVRLTRYTGSWQLKPVDGGKATLMRFQAGMDVGGHIPLFLARTGMTRDLPALFDSIRAMLAAGAAP